MSFVKETLPKRQGTGSQLIWKDVRSGLKQEVYHTGRSGTNRSTGSVYSETLSNRGFHQLLVYETYISSFSTKLLLCCHS